jgi:hypothetical protein
MLARALLVFAAALLLAPFALADAGPDPGVLQAGTGITGANGEVRFVTVPAASLTALEAISTHGGQILNSTLIRGGWGVPLVDYSGSVGGLSTNGKTLVLGQTGFGTCNPQGCTLLRHATRFQVINPKTLRPRATVTLPGDYAFDALSPNGQRLYLIQHLSAANANKYIVRAYDLKRRRLLPGAIADRTQRGWLMQGTPMARSTSASGRYVYTLYANPGGYPFVHALDAVAGRAHCIGIPWTSETTQGDLDSLKLSADGRQLSIGTRADAQTYFTLDTRTYRVTPFTAAPHGFRWWTLSFLALVILPGLAFARRRTRHAAPHDGSDLHAVPERA